MGNIEGKQLIYIDGGISSGKTTLCNLLKTHQERYMSFVSSIGDSLSSTSLTTLEETGHLHGILKAWIENPAELSAQFQMHMFSACVTRLNTAHMLLKYDPDVSCVMVDRSLDGNAVFATTSAIEPYNRLSKVEFDFYKTAFYADKALRTADTHTSLSPKPHCELEIFLWVKPETCISRCMQRGSDGESSYDVKYFQDLQMISLIQILSFLTTRKEKTPRRMVVLDWNEPRSDAQIVDTFYEEVRAFLHSGSDPRTVELSTSDPVDDSAYSKILDFSSAVSEREIFSPHNVESVFDAIVYSHRLPNESIFIKVPKKYIRKYPFDSPFKIKIN